MLEDVKKALSIDYSDPSLDSMLNLKIGAAEEFLKGVGIEKNEENDLYRLTVVTFVLDNWQLEAGKSVMSSLFLSFVTQMRGNQNGNR